MSVTIDDIRAAAIRLAPLLSATPLRNYRELDDAVGHGIRISVKHENFNPTGSFKVRNGLSFMTALADDARSRGVVAATRGNHGLGIAYAGRAFGVRTTICVPLGNNPDKNAGMRALGARLVEEGRDYDESVQVADRIDSGSVGINFFASNHAAPFGGRHDSGLGAEYGPEGLSAYLSYKSIHREVR